VEQVVAEKGKEYHCLTKTESEKCFPNQARKSMQE